MPDGASLNRRGILGLVAWVSTLAAVGCFGMRPASVPMQAVFHPATNPRATGLIVFLPGMGNGPAEYERSGFVDTVRRTNPNFDMIAADAHFGYFRNWQVTDRLHTDVIEPVLHRYESVWVVGISIGGLVATTYAMEHEDVVEGVIVLAPYLGNREILSEVSSAGGLRAWEPPDLARIDSFQKRHYYRLWSFFKEYAAGRRSEPRLYLGVGEDDGLFVPNKLLASHLPAERTATMPGGHVWKVWTPLFGTLAERAIHP